VAETVTDLGERVVDTVAIETPAYKRSGHTFATSCVSASVAQDEMQTEKEPSLAEGDKHGCAFYTEGRHPQDLKWNTVSQSSVGSFVADMQGSSGELCCHTPDPHAYSNMCLLEVTPQSLTREDYTTEETTGAMQHTICATALLRMPISNTKAPALVKLYQYDGGRIFMANTDCRHSVLVRARSISHYVTRRKDYYQLTLFMQDCSLYTYKHGDQNAGHQNAAQIHTDLFADNYSPTVSIVQDVHSVKIIMGRISVVNYKKNFLTTSLFMRIPRDIAVAYVDRVPRAGQLRVYTAVYTYLACFFSISL